jgi:hypothetical protein
MKQRARLLFDKSLDSFVLAIDHFNRPWDRGRSEAVLILLDRAFELMLKAIILHKGGKIREPYDRETIGFSKCVRKCITDAKVRCLSDEEGLTIQIINSFRDAAQHEIVELTEQQLYLYSQAGVTLYKDLLRRVFGKALSDYLPERVLPISIEPPRDLQTMIEIDFGEIVKLVKPRSRHQLEAKAKLKSWAIVEASLEGIRSQPSEFEINNLVKKVRAKKTWEELFPGLASLQLSTNGTGITVEIRITKREGEKVQIIPEGISDAMPLAIKRVNELDYYSLGLNDLAVKIGINAYKTGAVVRYLNLQDSEEYFKVIIIGKQQYKRYSAKALDAIKKALPELDLEQVCRTHRPKK